MRTLAIIFATVVIGAGVAAAQKPVQRDPQLYFAMSSVVAEPAAAPKGEKSTVTVTVKGTDGKPMAGKQVVLSSSRSNVDKVAVFDGGITNDDGVARFEITSETPGVSLLSATVEYMAIPQRARVVFTETPLPRPPDRATTSKAKLKDLVDVLGVRDNELFGYGLVIGLAGTGDTENVFFTSQSVANMLGQLGIRLDQRDVRVRNVAAVMVTARLPTFARPGAQIDVSIGAIGNARSLEGGVLLATPLKGADDNVYALAQGPIQVGGFLASGMAAQTRKNQVASGRIPNGGTVERYFDVSLPQALDPERFAFVKPHGLIWQVYPSNKQRATFRDAELYCQRSEELPWAGAKAGPASKRWRLPTYDELLFIRRALNSEVSGIGNNDPEIVRPFDKATNEDYFWTSTPDDGGHKYASPKRTDSAQDGSAKDSEPPKPFVCVREHRLDRNDNLGDILTLALRRPDFSLARTIRNQLRTTLRPTCGEASVTTPDPGSVIIKLDYKSEDCRDAVAVMATIEGTEVDVAGPAKIVISERTGTVVAGGDIKIRPVAIAHGSLQISISNDLRTSQPNAFSAGQTVSNPVSTVQAKEENNAMVALDAMTTVEQLARALNSLGVSPRDLVIIMQAIKASGAMDAELEVL